MMPRADLAKLSMDYALLYQREAPFTLGQTLPIHVATLSIDDVIMAETELEAEVCRLKRNKAGGHTHLCAKHLKGWMWDTYPDRDMTRPNSDHWEKLVTMAQNMWEHNTLPKELIWTILVFLQKGNADNQGIGLL